MLTFFNHTISNILFDVFFQNRIYKKTISRLKSQLKKLGFEPEVVSSEDDLSRHPPPVVQSKVENF